MGRNISVYDARGTYNMRHEDDKIALLLDCVRSVFPHLKSFSDQMLTEKIGSKKTPFIAEEFQSYVLRNQPTGIVVSRAVKTNEGMKLAKIVRDQLVAFHYPPVAITPKNLCENLSLIDDYFVRLTLADEEEEQRVRELIRKEREELDKLEDQQIQQARPGAGIRLQELMYA